MGNGFGVASFASLLGILGIVGSANAVTWKPVCESAGHTLLASSDHFEICKKATFDDGSTNNVSLDNSTAQAALKTLEQIFSTYHDSAKWMLPQPSNANEKLKSVAYVFESSKMGALYGGGNEEACATNSAGKSECSPGLWLGSGAFTDNWGLAHEYAHGLQSVAGWMGSNATAGWICESHANWMAHQVNPTDAHYCSEALINFPYLYYGSSRDRYCNWQFMEHLKEEFGGGWKGVEAVNRMWMNKINDGETGFQTQTPFSAMISAYEWQYEDLTKQLGKFAMKNATLEYAGAKKSLYKNTWGDYEFATRRTSDGWGDLYRRHGRVTMLNEMAAGSATGNASNVDGAAADVYYQVPSYWAPQRFGYNLVRIYPDAAGKVTVKFRGIVQQSKPSSEYGCLGSESSWVYENNNWVQKSTCNLSPETMPDPNSNWTVGLVAEGSDGTPRYSEMKTGTAFNLEIETKANDKALWLTVTATPSQLYTITWDQFYYTIYRYPYMVGLENAKPEGYQKDAWKPASTSGANHANGGGWVSSKASVAASAYVGPNAVVNGGTISGDVRIEDFAVVNGGTISGKAVVKGRALVSAGTISDNAVLADDAWLVSGTISGNAKVGALSIIVNSTITDNAQVQGVMWAVADKKLSGTAQLRGDLENNFTKELTKGVYYGMLDDGMLSDATYGVNRTEAPTEATFDYSAVKWYEIDEDSPTAASSNSAAVTSSATVSSSSSGNSANGTVSSSSNTGTESGNSSSNSSGDNSGSSSSENNPVVSDNPAVQPSDGTTSIQRASKAASAILKNRGTFDIKGRRQGNALNSEGNFRSRGSRHIRFF